MPIQLSLPCLKSWILLVLKKIEDKDCDREVLKEKDLKEARSDLPTIEKDVRAPMSSDVADDSKDVSPSKKIRSQ